MTTAIVTITCPSCGGRVEGVAATNEDQTVKCTFCGTELHIPAIGAVVHERVVREVVREVESAPVYASSADDAGVLRPRRSPVAGVIAIGSAFALFLVVMCMNRQESKDFDDRQAAEKAARDTCEANCKAQCAHAGDQETGKWNVSYPYGVNDDSLEKQVKDTDVTICQTECEMKADCIGLGRKSY